MTVTTDLPAGFSNPVIAAQATFRAVTDAMARPGTIQSIDATSGVPDGLMSGTAAVALTLFDHDTTIYLDDALAGTPGLVRWLTFHIGAPLTSNAASSDFAILSHQQATALLDPFAFGSDEDPHRSTTLIVQVESVTRGRGYRLQGPGIKGKATLHVSGGPADLFDQLSANAALFPRGLDVVLVADRLIVAVPRTTRITALED